MGAEGYFTITREHAEQTPFGYKRCTDCGELKPVEEFSRCKLGGEARFSRCKVCLRILARQIQENKKKEK
jgi:hypothetical protein